MGEKFTLFLELPMIAEPATYDTAAHHGQNSTTTSEVYRSRAHAVTRPIPNGWKCPMCMEDVEIHLFRRSLRDSVRSNPKLWKPVEKGFDALIAEDPIRSGSLADALKEVVNRNP